MQELRLSLAAARADLRSAKDDYELLKAQAEQRAIEAGLASGKNAEERSRALTIALARDIEYTTALDDLRRAEAEVERLDALLEGARDARRAEEWAVRARLADALIGAGVQSDGETGAEFDDGVDHALYADVERHLARQEPAYEEDLPF